MLDRFTGSAERKARSDLRRHRVLPALPRRRSSPARSSTSMAANSGTSLHSNRRRQTNPMSSAYEIDFGYRKPRARSRQFNELVAAMRDDNDNGEALRRATNRDLRRLEAEWKVVSKAQDEAGMISNLKSRQQLSRRLHDIYEIQMLKIRGRLKARKPGSSGR